MQPPVSQQTPAALSFVRALQLVETTTALLSECARLVQESQQCVARLASLPSAPPHAHQRGRLPRHVGPSGLCCPAR